MSTPLERSFAAAWYVQEDLVLLENSLHVNQLEQKHVNSRVKFYVSLSCKQRDIYGTRTYY